MPGSHITDRQVRLYMQFKQQTASAGRRSGKFAYPMGSWLPCDSTRDGGN